MATLLTVLLAYICALTFLYGTFQYRLLNFTIGVNSFCSIYFRAGHRLLYDGTLRVRNTVTVTVPSVS